jgi:hypothetical protein
MTKNLTPGVIHGSRVHKGVDKAITYAKTPVLAPEVILPGRWGHVGGGVWRGVCALPECGAYVEQWGTGWNGDLAHHEHSHGLDVVGVNVAMFS